MFAENDLIALRVDLPEHRLCAGDTGTVVSVHGESGMVTVEFMTLGGDTLALVSLAGEQVRAVTADEIAQARPLAAAA